MTVAICQLFGLNGFDNGVNSPCSKVKSSHRSIVIPGFGSGHAVQAVMATSSEANSECPDTGRWELELLRI
jgi:hypothetical protein